MDDDARIGCEARGELSPPDVDGMDPRRAPLEEDVGEAARRGPDVEADEPGRVDAKGVERGGELVAAATDVWIALHDRDLDIRIDTVACLPVEAGGVAGTDPDLASED